MKNKIASVFLALTLVAGAFAQATGIPPINPAESAKPDAAIQIQKELDTTKAQLDQLRTVAQQQIDILTIRAERGEYAFRAERLQQENVALRNAIAQAEARAGDQQRHAVDMSAKYEMEKAKVEALLKKHPTDAGVIAKIDAVPEKPAVTPAK